ncbi:uncharacterized protein M421DRAFT_67111 [Didymella exigua CBS 183.55]|uniref:Cohesin loading factor-domain-containing protein n=1 Tax=Didymella exigua CBS 183.55 TaxID=1150837 RepID=A0A6A5RGX2_9PLEO|nr:uncharacterized protein M421DRAFT_67111 [Didymella exigua CBS 183.55]KAF1926510.1 hypothetical protein M421DRAFT_67111 [Didymella exigua CBS 183.55]
MDPRYNQQYGYSHGSNGQYPSQQPQNGYPQYGQAPQYPPQYQQQYQQQYAQAQMQMQHRQQQHQQQQPQQRQPQANTPRPQSQQYMQMPQHQHTYPPQQQYQQSQYQQMPQQQLQYQQPSQQQQHPHMRQGQAPFKHSSSSGIMQMDGSQDIYRRQSAQQVPTPPMSKPVQRTSSHQEGMQPQLQQKNLPADMSVMLLSAADEYIAAARGMGPSVARQKKNGEVQQYYKLMSTAMGCMDAVLRKYNMQPRDEARLRLRYASLLIEETDNTAEIDEILSKGISLCARCRLQDLRYSMLHLQARYQYQTNHRAAFKALDKNISEAETFQQIAWVYAFRFLKVSLLLQNTERIEAIPALQQLHAINAHANKCGDTAVAFACSALEAMVHLRSSAQDRLVEAQRAIAQARSLQLTMSAEQQGSFGTIFSVVDLASSVHQNAPDSAKSTTLVQATADENDAALGTENGVFAVTLDRTAGGDLTTDTGGIFGKSLEGRDELVFSWLPREDIKALCFHICALDQSVHEKAMQLVQEARSRTRDSMRKQSPYGLPISTACAETQWRRVLDWNATFTLGLIATHREDQTTANDALRSLTRRLTTASYANQRKLTQLLSYLEAIIDQTSGRFSTALATYSSKEYALSDKGHIPTLSGELSILAAFNRLLIARDPAHPDHEIVGALLSQLRLACEEHPSQYVRMAFTLVNSLCTLDPSINRLKTLMNNATQKSHDLFKRTANREFVVMSLCYFTARFFVEPVTDKSSSAVNAVRQHAKQSNSPLWMAVACGLMIKVFEHHNSTAEKQKYEEIYEKVRVKLPAPLRGEDVDAEGEDDDGDIDLVG